MDTKHIELLYEVTRQFFASTLELDTVLGKVLSLTVESVQANKGSIFLFDTNGRVIRSILARANLKPEIKYPTVKKVMADGFAGWVYQQRRADIIYDTEQDERWYNFPDDTLVTRSAIAAPLIRKDQIIGVLTMTHPEPDRFTEDQLFLLEAIAIQAATAVEQAALYTWMNNERSMLRAVIGGVQDIILVADPRGRVLLANKAAHQHLGLPEDIENKSIESALTDRALLNFYHSAQGKETVRREVTLVEYSDDPDNKEGNKTERVFDCAIVPVPGLGTVLAMHDITTFKRLDALKSEFVNQVAHDLRNPIAIIHGFSSLLEQQSALPPEEVSIIQSILNTTNRMGKLVETLLDIGKIEMGIEAEFQALDMLAAAREAVTNNASLAAPKNIALQTDFSDDVVMVYAAPTRLQQAFNNLLGNAIAFTPQDGVVTVRLIIDSKQAVFSVTDTGPGISPAGQTKLFKKFSKVGQRATKNQEGSGLGLAIVKSVADAHNGRVWVESQEGKGSAFFLAIPLYKPAAK